MKKDLNKCSIKRQMYTESYYVFSDHNNLAIQCIPFSLSMLFITNFYLEILGSFIYSTNIYWVPMICQTPLLRAWVPKEARYGPCPVGACSKDRETGKQIVTRQRDRY